MSLLTILSMFISFIFEVIIGAVLLIKKPLNFRMKPYISIPIAILISFGVTIIMCVGLYFLYPKYIPWNEVTNITAYTIAVVAVYFSFRFAYKLDPRLLLLTIGVSYTFQHLAYQFNTLIFDTGLRIFMKENMSAFAENAIYTTGTYFVKIAIYIACYFLFVKSFKKNSKHIFKTTSIVLSIIALYLMINVVNTFIVQRYGDDLLGRGVLSASLIIFCILYDTLIIGGLYVTKNREEATIIEATLSAKVRQYEIIEQNMNFINIKFHDLRKELRRLKNKKDALTDEDFNLIEHSLSLYDSDIDSGDVNIDMLIQDKLINCKSMGIEFTPLVDADALKDLKQSDVYFLLMNIIDNAIEAVSNLEKEEQKVITLVISKKRGAAVIEQTNYFDGKIKINKDGSIKTTKKEGKFHGYGTKSIAYIVKKYNGTIDYQFDKNIFTLTIVI